MNQLKLIIVLNLRIAEIFRLSVYSMGFGVSNFKIDNKNFIQIKY